MLHITRGIVWGGYKSAYALLHWNQHFFTKQIGERRFNSPVWSLGVILAELAIGIYPVPPPEDDDLWNILTPECALRNDCNEKNILVR